MTDETRVGFKSTSILEEACLEYIKIHTVSGKFIGDVDYLILYDRLRTYNKTSD